MHLKAILENKVWMLSSAALLIVPIYTWKKLYKTYKEEKAKYENEELFHKRHNCVVMYSSSNGMKGWPPHTKRVKASLKSSLELMTEPFVFFINTAQKTLDIAVMLIKSNYILNAISEANKRGVRVRLIMNFDHSLDSGMVLRKMIKEGIAIQFYISHKSELSSIFHYKYMVKDYSETGGFVCMGSMNITNTAFLNNYEDLVFTSNQYVVESVNENFEECWREIYVENQNLYNRTLLKNAKFI